MNLLLLSAALFAPVAVAQNVSGGAGSPSVSPLPIPSDMYNGQCPFQSWYSGLPDHFAMWERYLIGKYHTAWENAGKPTGIRLDDHDYDTSLGQGNTLGFLAARLEFLEDVPEFVKHGLFAQSGTVPAVVRMSDFGADESVLRLARMAVKVPLSSAWGGEANLLFTETMDSFPLADYEDLTAFAGDDTVPWYQRVWDNIKMAADGLVVGVQDALKVYQALKVEPLAKSYYSQLPYMLGKALAMKFQLSPKQKTCGEDGADSKCCLPPTHMPSSGEAPRWASERASVTASYLSKCDAVFELQLQVKSFDANKDEILHSADSSWGETPITVATLTIPKQAATSTWAVGEQLRSNLASILGVQPEGVDKMFAFHPINNHEANRPVGDINTFRSAFYSQNTMERFRTIHNGVFKDTNNAIMKTVKQMPFQQLQAAGVLFAENVTGSVAMRSDDVVLV